MFDKKAVKDHLGYYATSDGEVIRPDGSIADKYINDRGYKIVIINGRPYKNHEIVLKAFSPEQPKYLKSKGVPNHFDLDRSNNNILNLDWVDMPLNAIHSALMRDKNPTFSKLKTIDENGIVVYYTSIFECARAIGLGLLETWEKIKSQEPYKGKTICYLERNERDRKNYISVFHAFKQVISCFDFKDNKQLPDMRVWELGRLYNLTPQLIMEHIADELNPRYMLGDLLIAEAGTPISSLIENHDDYRKIRLIYMWQNPLRFKLYTSLDELVKDNPLNIDSNEPLTEYKTINSSTVSTGDVVSSSKGHILHVPTHELMSPESYILNKLFDGVNGVVKDVR